MRYLIRVGMLVIAALDLSAWGAGAANLVPNSGFETCPTSPAEWGPVDSETMNCDSSNPFAGSGAAVLSGTSASGGALVVQAESTCVSVAPDSILTNGSVSYRTGDQSVYQVAFSIFFYSAADCSGSPGSVSSIGGGFSFGPALVKDGQWQTLTGNNGVSVPSDVHALKFRLSFQFTTPGTAAVAFDALSAETNATTSTTMTTIPGSTTTTTSPVDCALMGCEDGDPCTTDACVAGTCTHTTHPGVAGAVCLVVQMQTTPLCGVDPVPVKPSAAIAGALDRANALLTKLDALTGKKRTKVRKKAASAIGRIAKVVTKASHKGQVSNDCANTVVGAATRIQTAITGL